MNLFFETSRQANCFLCVVPLGFATALLLDLSRFFRRFRPVADAVALLLAGLGVLVVLILCGDSGLRLYHLLGLGTGMILYLQGIGKIIGYFRDGRISNHERRNKTIT